MRQSLFSGLAFGSPCLERKDCVTANSTFNTERRKAFTKQNLRQQVRGAGAQSAPLNFPHLWLKSSLIFFES